MKIARSDNMNIFEATRAYERWLARYTTPVQHAIRYKHAQMKSDKLAFLRGTFYRWVQVYQETCGDLCRAPVLLAVGDLHIGSFGTWRDSEGRMVWGIDDFDEAYPLPYTNDLVRLASSVKVARDCESLHTKLSDACELILDGYRHSLRSGGCPIVLEEEEDTMRHLGIREIVKPEDFWSKLNRLPAVNTGVPTSAKEAIEKELPETGIDYKIVRRMAGVGSLGQERYVAIAKWCGGFIAREAKAMVPSACAWLASAKGSTAIHHNQITAAASRSPDPFQKVHNGWLVRRLSPDSNPIEITSLPKQPDEECLLYSMGMEAGNVHLGSKIAIKRILNDLSSRKPKWLATAAKTMAKSVTLEWKQYKKR